MNQQKVRYSLLVQVFNDAGNIKPFHERVKSALPDIRPHLEIIYVDDGSVDDSFNELISARGNDTSVRLIRFDRNYGRHAAFMAGFERASGDYILTMDVDLQYDPEVFIEMIQRIDQGYELVNGWRYQRSWDYPFRKTATRIANRLICRNKHKPVQDATSPVKVFSRSILSGGIPGRLSRFPLEYAVYKADRVAEVPIKHHSREKGGSSYHFSLLAKEFILMAIAFSTIGFSEKHGPKTRTDRMYNIKSAIGFDEP